MHDKESKKSLKCSDRKDILTKNKTNNEAKNEFLSLFNKFQEKNREIKAKNGTFVSKEKETILEKNRKAKCFSEIDILDPKPSNVSKLRSFFENSGNRAQNRTKNTTPQTGRKKKVGKNFPPEGQKPINMFFGRKENGQQRVWLSVGSLP